MTRPLLRTPLLLAAAGVLVVGLLAGCGATAPGGGGAPTAGLSVATAPPPDSADPDQDAPDPGSAYGPSANSAPVDTITAALGNAGVSDPARWAAVVVAHRPYPADDPKLTRLRAALTAEKASPAMIDEIVGALAP